MTWWSPLCPSGLKRDKVHIDDFEVVKILGHGYKSRVVHVKDRTSAIECALKIYDKAKLNQLQRVQVQREIAIQGTLASSYVISIYGAFEDEDNVCLLLELASKDLYRTLKSKGTFGETQARHLMLQLVSALEVLHHAHIIHRDIKPENVLVFPDGSIKLGDFGLAIDFDLERPVTRAGTLQFVSPEVLRQPDKEKPEENKDMEGYTSATDIFSLGVLGFELLTGKNPFKGESKHETMANILSLEVTYPDDLSDEAKSFLACCLQKEAAHRFTASELKRHAWFAVGRTSLVGLPNRRHRFSIDSALAEQKSFLAEAKGRDNSTKISNNVRRESLTLPGKKNARAQPSMLSSVGANASIHRQLQMRAAGLGTHNLHSLKPLLGPTHGTPNDYGSNSASAHGCAISPAPWAVSPAPRLYHAGGSGDDAASRDVQRGLPGPTAQGAGEDVGLPVLNAATASKVLHAHRLNQSLPLASVLPVATSGGPVVRGRVVVNPSSTPELGAASRAHMLHANTPPAKASFPGTSRPPLLALRSTKDSPSSARVSVAPSPQQEVPVPEAEPGREEDPETANSKKRFSDNAPINLFRQAKPWGEILKEGARRRQQAQQAATTAVGSQPTLGLPKPHTPISLTVTAGLAASSPATVSSSHAMTSNASGPPYSNMSLRPTVSITSSSNSFSVPGGPGLSLRASPKAPSRPAEGINRNFSQKLFGFFAPRTKVSNS